MGAWLLYAIAAAVFAALTTILAKVGLKGVDSHLATAIRVLVVLVFAWLMVLIVGSHAEIGEVDSRTWTFLILSGLATGGSWLCFFRALQLGRVNQVVPVDKSSTIMTMILAFIFLREPVGALTVVGMLLMAVGTWMMLELGKKSDDSDQTDKRHGWLFFALLAAVFASLTAVLGRVGIENVEANLGTAIRTLAVVPMSWLMVFITGGQKGMGQIQRRHWVFLVLSGVATGASWLFFYRALQLGNASHVVPIDKLSIVLTMGFAGAFLGERFSKRSIIGLVLLTVGTLLPIVLA